MGGVLIIFTMDHTQIQPIGGKSSLTSCQVISCFKMVPLENSVYASDNAPFRRIQEVERFNYRQSDEEPELIDEFMSLCESKLTCLDNWDNIFITPSMVML